MTGLDSLFQLPSPVSDAGSWNYYKRKAESTKQQIAQEKERLDGLSLPWDDSDLKWHSQNTIQKIFQDVIMNDDFSCSTFQISPRALRAGWNIVKCRTPYAGINTDDVCEHCRTAFFHYNSCHDPNCMVCQSAPRELWVKKNARYLLDVPYAHIVFTLPHELLDICKVAPRVFYNLMFKAARETLDEFSRDPKWLGGTPGYMLHLHTGGSSLNLHPHLHCLFSCAGLDENLKLVYPQYKSKKSPSYFLFPARALARMFRGKFLYYLIGEIHRMSETPVFRPCEDQDIIDELTFAYEHVNEKKKDFLKSIEKAKLKNWNVEIRSTVLHGENVIQYLGKYINRLPISESAIESYENGEVKFWCKDYKKQGQKKLETMSARTFVRSLLRLVPPQGMPRTRFFGFWANRSREMRFKEIRRINGMKEPDDLIDLDLYELMNEMRQKGRDYYESHPQYHKHQNKPDPEYPAQHHCHCSHQHHHCCNGDHCTCGQPESDNSHCAQKTVKPEASLAPESACFPELKSPDLPPDKHDRNPALSSAPEFSIQQPASVQLQEPASAPIPEADGKVNPSPAKKHTKKPRDSSICPVCGQKRRSRPFNKKWPKPAKLWMIRDMSRKMRLKKSRKPVKRR